MRVYLPSNDGFGYFIHTTIVRSEVTVHVFTCVNYNICISCFLHRSLCWKHMETKNRFVQFLKKNVSFGPVGWLIYPINMYIIEFYIYANA